MKLIQVVPDAEYFTWQLYVQMQNFRNYGIEQDAIILVATGNKRQPSEHIKKFEEWTKASVFYYNDTRAKARYISGVRPHLLAKHLKEHPLDCYFYHDQDIIFLEQPKLDELGNSSPFCYVAAAAHNYTCYNPYIKQFKEYIFPTMAEIVGVDTKDILANDKHAGGAQYIIKGVDYKFWIKVERDAEALYSYMADVTKEGIRKYKPDEVLPEYHIQIWCADMWAVFWNLLLFKKEVRHHHNIDFCWPYSPKEQFKPIMHNAGIDGNNQDKVLYDVLDKDGKIISAEPVIKHWAVEKCKEVEGSSYVEKVRVKEYFNKSRYNGQVFPFEDDFSFVSPDRAQYAYIQLFNHFKQNTMTTTTAKKKVLGIFCTTNDIHPDLLKLTLSLIKKAVDNTKDCVVDIVTVSWKQIPDNPFRGYITPYNKLGHLNYILQMKQGLFNDQKGSDIVCILEHDVMYPDNYFDEVVNNWSAAHYGVCFNNYIGMNQTGYCDVVARHQPMSLMSFAKFFFETLLSQKVDEVVKSIGDELQRTHYPMGWTCVEPDDKGLMKFVEFTNIKPAIHVNMNKTAHRHHFTGHADVCYEQDAQGKTLREDWGDYKQWFTFI